MGDVALMTRPRSLEASISFDDWTSLFSLDSPLYNLRTTMPNEREELETSFEGFVRGAYTRNGVVFACLAARAKLFSQARFQYQQMFGGRTGALFGTPELGLLEHPEPGETTDDMLFRAILDADLGGDWFGVRRTFKGGTRIKRLRPDWTAVVLGSRNPDVEPEAIGWDPDTEVVGYGFLPGGPSARAKPYAFGVEEVSHFYPNRDPLARYRGVPLIVAVMREMLADSAATNHKLAFFRNAATPNLAINLPAGWDEDKAKSWIETFEGKQRGSLNAYRTLYFGGGMTAQVIGKDFQQMTFKELQGSAETRIAAATGMHPVVVGLSEGLAGSSLNAGNFGSAARLVGDITLRPLWQNMSGSLETIITTPPSARLWYDEKGVAFLRADIKDQANVQQIRGQTIRTYIEAGFTPASSVDAVISGDESRLQHTGMLSVQLQPPGMALPAAYRVTGDFWATEGALAQLGTIPAGTVIPADHPLVRAFPSMLEPAEAEAPLGTAPVVTRAQVLAKRQELLGAGREAGYDTLAAELHVSRGTIRRRLVAGA
jgi:hypothetical protein